MCLFTKINVFENLDEKRVFYDFYIGTSKKPLVFTVYKPDFLWIQYTILTVHKQDFYEIPYTVFTVYKTYFLWNTVYGIVYTDI